MTTWSLATHGQSFKRKVGLEWEPVEDATGYEVKIIRILEGKERKKPIIFKLKEPKWSATVRPGQYELQLRSRDERGVPGEWSEPTLFLVKIPAPTPLAPKNKAQLKTKENKFADVNLKWSKIEGAKDYRLEVKSEDGNYNESWDTDDLAREISLPVAKTYKWRVTAIMKEGTTGEIKEEFDTFTVIGAKIDKPEIETPPTKFVQELEWDVPDYVETYDYLIQRRLKNEKWKTIQKVTQFKGEKIPFDLANPTGRYRLILQAKASLRQSSSVAKKEFDIQGGLRSPAAIEAAKLKESIEKPTNLYFIASYFITQVTYAGFSNNNRSTFNAVGGTGRLGLGYQWPNSNWGTFGIVDLGGFTIGSDNYTFSSMELHGTWKKYFDANQVNFTAGFYQKELPALTGTAVAGIESVEIFSMAGPHVGFKYWRPINYKYGFQLNGRVYYALSGSPGVDGEFQPSMSYQFGVLGSLRWAHNIMCYAGYAYRLDTGSFIPEGSSGTRNIELQGHYLNLLLEYSF